MIQLVPFGTQLYARMLDFRAAHLRQPLGLTQDAADLAGEEQQLHLANVENGIVLATLVLKPVNATTIKLRQMAVAESMRGQGVGRDMVRFAETVARDRGFARVELHARVTAQPFYEALGYRVIGPAFIEVTVPHVPMARDLDDRSLTAALPAV
ncbi:GNAT family N-acetyltransferase [Lichenifustis flavocetrariae]|uniref:GNAT family N-acetyltransferase n=1 Tax=Lichenifustis flavocetrariae TaxID=2949735 RepID=A0AA42CPL3_9HYPH|nr:GNAT family N-acetyltransferase [Lichenifustis flavocetrariae]MCW6510532.1 GNAT family N-acetyltransferase [Lichenifustis flavocetrariae]